MAGQVTLFWTSDRRFANISISAKRGSRRLGQNWVLI
jgi:hypothetical protein